MKVTKLVVGHPAKLSEDDRQELEALRDKVSKTQWEIARVVWRLRGDYHFEDLGLGITWPRSEVADACGVMPKEVDSMVSTVARVGDLAEDADLDICYNAWKYIARHDDPQSFLDELLDDMENWGGKFPPVSVIRMKLADSKGNPPPPKPRKWTGYIVRMQPFSENDFSRNFAFYTIRLGVADDEGNVMEYIPDGTPVTLIEEPHQ